MGNLETTVSNSTQTITNDFLNSSNQQCISWSQNVVSDATIIANKSRIRNIEIIAQGTADLGCTINQQVTTSVTSQLVAQATQEANIDSSFLQLTRNIAVSVSNQSQSLYNNVSNITNSTCGSIQQSTVDNGLIIANEVRGGRIGIEASGNASANCSLTNMIALEAYNQGVNTTSQTSTIEAGFGGLIVAIIALIILIVIIVIIAGVAKKIFTPAPPQPPQPEPGSLEAELAAI